MKYFLFAMFAIPVGGVIFNFPTLIWLTVGFIVLWGLDKIADWQVQAEVEKD